MWREEIACADSKPWAKQQAVEAQAPRLPYCQRLIRSLSCPRHIDLVRCRCVGARPRTAGLNVTFVVPRPALAGAHSPTPLARSNVPAVPFSATQNSYTKQNKYITAFKRRCICKSK